MISLCSRSSVYSRKSDSEDFAADFDGRTRKRGKPVNQLLNHGAVSETHVGNFMMLEGESFTARIQRSNRE
jgi:hypothetical protein